MKFQDTLNTKLWDLETNDLQPEVKSKLEEIADAFIEYIEIPQDAILDMVITGSSASYNYNEHSDLDLHIIVDYDKIHDDCPLVEGYLGALKNTFNKEHDIFIHGVPVELYAEQKDQGTVHNGLYSLNTGWIDEPQKIPPTDNDAAVEAKFNEIKEMVDKCNDSEEADELLDKIYNMRKAGLAEAGEFCTENLAFKKLRNEGCMDKLRQLKKEKIDKQLSLESYQLEERDKTEYLTTSDKESALRKFSKLHANLIEPLPNPYDGDSDIEAVLYYLGSLDGLVAKVKTPIETVIFNEKNLKHLINDNEPQRLRDLSKIKPTLTNPNLVIETIEDGTKKNNYIKAFGNEDLMKAQLVVVKVSPDGTFYVTTFRLKNRKFLDKLKDGQIVYDLSDTYANKDESLSYNNIINNFSKKIKCEGHQKMKSIKEDHTFIDEYEVSETRGDWIITKDFNYNFASHVAAISNKYNLKVYLSYYDHELIKDYKGEETYNDIKWDDDEVPNLLSVEDALYYIGLPNSFPTEEFKKAIVDINDDIKTNYDAYWDTYHERHSLPKPNKNESIKEDYKDDDYEDIPEEMHKERYVTYFETPEGRQKYTTYHVYTDSTDDSYNELCDKRDNQLGMYNSYKELKDALKERAEKIAAKQGWTVKSIDNLGEDDEYYKERNKWESIKETQESLNEEDDKFNYMMLGRLKQDCEYFLGNGNGHEKHLWAGNVEDQISEMRKIYDKLPEKPEWLSLEDIDKYEKDMLEKRDTKNESIINIHKELNKYMNKFLNEDHYTSQDYEMDLKNNSKNLEKEADKLHYTDEEDELDAIAYNVKKLVKQIDKDSDKFLDSAFEESLNEDLTTFCDKIDKIDAEVKDLIKSIDNSKSKKQS